MSKNNGDNNTPTRQIRLDDEAYACIKALSKRYHTTINQAVRFHFGLDKPYAEAPAAPIAVGLARDEAARIVEEAMEPSRPQAVPRAAPKITLHHPPAKPTPAPQDARPLAAERQGKKWAGPLLRPSEKPPPGKK